MPAPRPVVSVAGLVVDRRSARALDGVDLDVLGGRVTGLFGPSGSGKTTLMRAIVGTQRITRGRVTVLGRPAGHHALRSSIGYATQQPAVYTDLSVVENVRYFAALFVRRRDVRSAVDAALRMVDLDGLRSRRVASLSGGQVSRVSIACALAGSPTLLVLDEPTVGLDPLMRRELWATFARLARGGVTLLVSSHVMEEADHCDDLVLLREGRVVARTTPDDLRSTTGCTDLDDAFVAAIDASCRPDAGALTGR